LSRPEGGGMTDYVVTEVRMESSDQGEKHEHIEGVCTTAGNHYTRKEVVDSLNDGKDWQTYADGAYAKIRKITYCKHSGRMATPYITTDADATAKNNLDNLARC
jgi:Protein of unknown function (DUF3892)